MASPSMAMDPRIWRNLPPNLLDRILAFLPPPSFFRARAVCKRFYSLLFSDTFLEMHLHLSPSLHWFLFFPSTTIPTPTTTTTTTTPTTLSTAFLLNTNDNTWHHLSFSSLIPPNFSPAASSGGLLCFISTTPGLKTLILCNPLSKLISQLPSSLRPRLFPSVGLTVGHSSFICVIAGDDLISPFAVKNLTAETFHADGLTGFYSPWTTASSLPRLCNLESGLMLFISGRFYCMNYSPFSVLAYDVASNDWFKIQAPMRRFLRCPSLVDLGGRVVLVAAVEKSKLNVPRSLRLWVLQPCGRAWAELDRMPAEVYRQFSEAEGGHGFECVGHGCLIVITIKDSNDILLFDSHRKVWWWAPPCPFLDGRQRRGLRGFAYEPRLATPSVGLLESPTSISFHAFSA
ncbi:F-box domain-containing protein [Dioscorea alata]|uniref:F-box domain-containing protein n=1 Tax=Dioscorea alata TaxID=55571 RepID=A0ACB7U2S1_DIOAL|nr:F-box domain-containing protein [Dioscorea alata]